MDTLLRVVSIAAITALLGPATAMAGDDAVRFEDLPAPVRETAEREVGDGRITEVEVETKHDSTVYEVEFQQGAVEYELEIAQDGTLLSREQD